MSIFIAPAVVLDVDASNGLDCPVFLWNNLVTVSGIAADHEDADYQATNLANPSTASLWKSGATGNQSIVFTVDPNAPVNGIGFARHNFGSTSTGITISGKTADVGATYTTLAEVSPGDDSAILAVVTAGYYTSIKVDFAPTGSAEPQMAVVYIGSLLRMPRSTPAGFVLLKDALDTTTLNGFAENGDFLGDIITSKKLSTTLDFKLLDGDWFRSNMRDFTQSRVPFFVARSPSLLPTEMGYAKFNGSPKGQVNQLTGEVDVSVPITGLAL